MDQENNEQQPKTLSRTVSKGEGKRVILEAHMYSRPSTNASIDLENGQNASRRDGSEQRQSGMPRGRTVRMDCAEDPKDGRALLVQKSFGGYTWQLEAISV